MAGASVPRAEYVGWLQSTLTSREAAIPSATPVKK
jgi:hypothetical protein